MDPEILYKGIYIKNRHICDGLLLTHHKYDEIIIYNFNFLSLSISFLIFQLMFNNLIILQKNKK
jgi:hypothetical protein